MKYEGSNQDLERLGYKPNAFGSYYFKVEDGAAIFIDNNTREISHDGSNTAHIKKMIEELNEK